MRLGKRDDGCRTAFRGSVPDGARHLVTGATLLGKLKANGTVYHAQQAIINRVYIAVTKSPLILPYLSPKCPL